MGHYTGTFFCDNCSAPSASVKHTVRITKDGHEITSDVCETCGVKQEIESAGDSTGIQKLRVRNTDETGKK